MQNPCLMWFCRKSLSWTWRRWASRSIRRERSSTASCPSTPPWRTASSTCPRSKQEWRHTLTLSISVHKPFRLRTGWRRRSSVARSCTRSRVAAISSSRRRTATSGSGRNSSRSTRLFATRRSRSVACAPTSRTTRRRRLISTSASRYVTASVSKNTR